MKDYELTVITRDESTAPIEQAIEAAGGRITNRHALGRKSFAYPIQKETAGYYTAFRLQLKPKSVTELNRAFKLTDGLLRHLTVELLTHKLASNLDVDELKEAKDVATEQQRDTETDKERGKLLDKQLSKLIGNENTKDKE